MCFERFSTEVKMYDHAMKVVQRIVVPFEKKAFILSVAFDDKSGIYGFCGSDSTLYFYRRSKIRFELTRRIEAEAMAGSK